MLGGGGLGGAFSQTNLSLGDTSEVQKIICEMQAKVRKSKNRKVSHFRKKAWVGVPRFFQKALVGVPRT